MTLDRFIAAHASSLRTLDIGAQNGPYAAHFPRRVALDIQRGAGVQIIGDVQALGIRDASVDVVLCTEVLEHVPDPQRAIDEMYRVLVPGGQLLLTTRFLFPIHDAPHDYFRFTKYGLRHLLRRFEITEVQEETDAVGTLAVLLQRLGMQAETLHRTPFRAIWLLVGASGAAVFLPDHPGVRVQPATAARTGHHDERLPRRLPEASMNPAPPDTADREFPLIAAAALTVAVTLAVYLPALRVNFLGDDFMILHRLRSLERATDVLRFFRGEFFRVLLPARLCVARHRLGDRRSAGAAVSPDQRLDPRHQHAAGAADWTSAVAARARRSTCRSPLRASRLQQRSGRLDVGAIRSPRHVLCAGWVCWMVRAWRGNPWVPAFLFLCAVLSKEAAVAMPIVAAAWSSFRMRDSTATTIARVAPWLGALVVYSVLRQVAGGVSAVGGASRIPKLLAFGTAVVAITAMSGGRWELLRDWLRPRRWPIATILLTALVASTLASALFQGPLGILAREKLSVAGFATFYLTSPVLNPGDAVFNGPSESLPWIVGAVTLLVVIAVIVWLWHRLLDDSRFWFLAAFLVATLLPVSALTEGKRYLDLPSAAMALILAILIVESDRRWRRVALVAAAGMLVVSAVQIAVKIGDWRWAGQMTADGARLVDSTLAPSCGTGHVVFLTSPVGIRGVDPHFYYETFEVPRGCMPDVFQVVVRAFGGRQPDRRQLERARANRDHRYRLIATTLFLLSHDLRAFDSPLRAGHNQDGDPARRFARGGRDGVGPVTLNCPLRPSVNPFTYFYYSGGEIKSSVPPSKRYESNRCGWQI